MYLRYIRLSNNIYMKTEQDNLAHKEVAGKQDWDYPSGKSVALMYL